MRSEWNMSRHQLTVWPLSYLSPRQNDCLFFLNKRFFHSHSSPILTLLHSFTSSCPIKITMPNGSWVRPEKLQPVLMRSERNLLKANSIVCPTVLLSVRSKRLSISFFQDIQFNSSNSFNYRFVPGHHRPKTAPRSHEIWTKSVDTISIVCPSVLLSVRSKRLSISFFQDIQFNSSNSFNSFFSLSLVF